MYFQLLQIAFYCLDKIETSHLLFLVCNMEGSVMALSATTLGTTEIDNR